MCECQYGSSGGYGSDGVSVGMTVICECGIDEAIVMTVGGGKGGVICECG